MNTRSGNQSKGGSGANLNRRGGHFVTGDLSTDLNTAVPSEMPAAQVNWDVKLVEGREQPDVRSK